MSNWPDFKKHDNYIVDAFDSAEFVWLDEQQYNEARDAIAEVAELRQLLSDLYHYSQWGGDYPNFAKIENAIRATAPEDNDVVRKLECGHCGTFNYAGSVCFCRRPITDRFIIDSKTDPYTSQYATDSSGRRWVTKDLAEHEIAKSEIEVAELRKKLEAFESVIAECNGYLNYNEFTNISHGSILHRKMQELLPAPKEAVCSTQRT